MPTPSDLLHAITDEVAFVLSHKEALNPQQLTFVRHIEKLAHELLAVVQPMPQSADALQRIFPTLGDAFLQQQAALFGYAKLLLEHPQSFDGADVPHIMQASMQGIYQHGQSLHTLTDQILNTASQNRIQGHRTPPEIVNLADLLQDEVPILQYFLHQYPVELTVLLSAVTVHTSTYHLIALVQHIITTLASELNAQGQIKLTTQNASPFGIIDIFCTDFQLNSEANETLFNKQGRYIYLRHLEKEGGYIKSLPELGNGSSIQLFLPQS